MTRFERSIRSRYVACSLLGATILGSVLSLLAAEVPKVATVEKRVFEVSGQSFLCPVQTGRGRKALVERHGLYRLPADTSAAFNLGRKLRVLADEAVFVRGVDNLYSGENAIWTGDLHIEGAPASLPPPPVQGVVTADGHFRALFRAEEDRQFLTNMNKEPAPSWYFPKKDDIIGERVAQDGTRKGNRVRVAVEVVSPRPGPALIRIGLNSNAPAGKPNRLVVFLNGTELVSAEWSGLGYRVVQTAFEGGFLRDGENVVELLGDTGYSKYLDFVEIETNAAPALREGKLVVRAEADGPGFSVPGALRAVDVTEAGEERDLPGRMEAGALHASLQKGRLYYITSVIGSLTFSPEVRLEEPAGVGGSLVVVGPVRAEAILEPFLEAKRLAGLSARFVPFEQVRDVYNGGVYGPRGLETMVRRLGPKYLLIASGFHRDGRRREPGTPPASDFMPGVPAVFRHVEQLTVSDDDYTLGQTVGVGRIPARSAQELSAWVAKVLAYVPSDQVLLLAGHNDRENFPLLQKNELGNFPASLVSFEGLARGAVVPAVRGALDAGGRLVVYQGHGQSGELDKGMLMGKDGGSFPPSSWLLATCNSAYYFADFEVFLKDWLFHPSGGAVHAIAATSLARADVQDAMVKAFLQALAKKPDLTWGGMLNLLKRTVPVHVESLGESADVPAFFRAQVAEERKSVEVMTLLGDPSAPILPVTRRQALVRFPSLAKEGATAPSGALAGEMTLSGPWSAGNLSGLALAWSPGARSDEWREIARTKPFSSGMTSFVVPAGTGEADGGPLRLRLVERRAGLPEVVWLETKVVRESSKPRAPTVNARRVYTYAAGGFAWTCRAANPGTFAESKPLFAQFQVGARTATPTGPAGSDHEVCGDTGWVPGLQQGFDETSLFGARFVRARIQREGVTGEWSPWRPLEPADKGETPKKTTLRVQRLPGSPGVAVAGADAHAGASAGAGTGTGTGQFVIPLPMTFGLEARFEVREKGSQSTLLATEWLKSRRLAVDGLPGGDPKRLEVRAALREGGLQLDWSDWQPVVSGKQ